jgi:chemotaxis protein methyltransferase CheR
MKDEVRKLLESINEYYGYDLRDYHIDFSIRAAKNEMSYRSISDVKTFCKALLTDEYKVNSFIRRHLISVSDMFRDIEPFRIFREQVIPDLRSYPRIKIWSCGCASGKEALSLAIILQEEGLDGRALVYATDINQKALDTAINATYSIDDVIGFTQNYYLSGGKQDFRKYYTINWENKSVCFNKDLLKNIYFSIHNLVSDKVFNEFEVVFCRNVVIYFNDKLQERSLGLLKDSLCYRGHLFLGNSEHMNFKGISEYFRVVDKNHNVYQKKYSGAAP